MKSKHRRMILLVALIVLVAGALVFLRNPETFGLYPCDGQLLTKAQVAEARGLSVETMDLLRTRRDLRVTDVCVIPQAKLDRAVQKATSPMPDHPGEALEFRNLQLQNENGYIPPDGLARANEQIKAMQAYDSQHGLRTAGIARDAWVWLGPGNIGGRVRAIAVHPTDPNILWVGSVAGGIWKTTDAGASWSLLDDFMANMAVSTLVIDPADPSVLYAGTGEGFYNADGIRGEGIFKTTDGGTTWTQLASTANSDFYYVNRLSLSPDRTTLLAATGSGIWRSTDGGSTWTQTLDIWSKVKDLDFDPSDSNKAIASGSDGLAWYSTDGGLAWNAASFSPATTVDWLDRVEVAYAPSSPNIVYAGVNQNSGEVYKSTDGGQTYARVNTGTSYLGGQGWYDNIVWVHPTNPNFVVVGGIDIWRSTSGGSSFTQISQWWSAPNSAHADNHIIVAAQDFASTNTVYVGDDGGVYRAANINTVSLTIGWRELNNQFGVTQFYGAAGNPTTGEIVGGTQDNGTLFYTPAQGTEGWTSPFGGDGGFSAADPTDPNYFYGEYVYLTIHRSANRGLSSSYIYSGISDASNCANFIAPFILDPNNPNTLLAGGCSLWRSTNVKATTPSWSAIKGRIYDGASNPVKISAVAAAPGNSDIIWVGYNDGRVYKTGNGTAASPTWTQVTGLPSRYVMRITIDKNNNSVVYVTFGGFSPDNIYHTPDGGTTWNGATGSGLMGLPDLPVRSLVIHPDNSNWIYAGTELGIFASEDSGANWTVPHEGPTNTSVDELFWMGDVLVAATHGRGLFRTGGTPPAAPSNFRVTGVTETSASLAWDDVSGETGYKIYKWNGSTFAELASVGTDVTTYTDTTVMCGTSAQYKLSAYNVSGESALTNSIQADLPACPFVANDDFDSPTVFSALPYSTTQSTLGATTAPDDPALTGCNRNAGLSSVWFAYTPSAVTALSIDTFGSDFNTMIGVWTGSRGNLVEVACNDNAGGGSQSSVNVIAQVGVTYFIGVSGYNGIISMPDFGASTVPQILTSSGNLVFNVSSVPAQSASFLSNGSQDGHVREYLEASETGKTVNSRSSQFYVGDDRSNRQYRGFLSFDTSALPNSATVVSVTLKLQVARIIGTNPFTTHGSLLVDIRQPFFGTMLTLEPGDFQASASQDSVGVFSIIPDVGGWYTSVLDSAAFPYISLTGTTQFRLRFALDDDNDRRADYLRFYSGNSKVYQPLIEIVYYP